MPDSLLVYQAFQDLCKHLCEALLEWCSLYQMLKNMLHPSQQWLKQSLSNWAERDGAAET